MSTILLPTAMSSSFERSSGLRRAARNSTPVERLTTSGFDRGDVNLTASASPSRRNRRRDTLEAVGPNGRLGPVKICETVTSRLVTELVVSRPKGQSTRGVEKPK